MSTSSTSKPVIESATNIFLDVQLWTLYPAIAAVATIAVSLILFPRICRTRKRSQQKATKLGQEHCITSQPQPELVDQNVKDEHKLYPSILEHPPPGTPGPHTLRHPDAQRKDCRGIKPEFSRDEVNLTQVPTANQSIDSGDKVVQRVGGEAPSMSFFQGSSNFSISNSSFSEIHGDATIIRFGDEQFTESQRNLICDYMANLVVLPAINDNLNRSFLTQLIINLPRAEAVFNDYQTKKRSGPCLEGTRVALLLEMADWATSWDESRMYILSGLAGIGKSTIAYTIASRAAELNFLGGSFFFSRDEADRKNAKKFFTTIAYQFCVYNETFAKAIGDALLTERGSAATTKDPQEQLQALITEPLRGTVQSRTRPILVVIDALDECDEEDVLYVLTGLSQLVRDLPPFKVILTTRPLSYLDRFFGGQDGHRIFHLQDIEDKIVDGDIRLYLRHSLSQEQVKGRLQDSDEDWYASETEIESLVRMAGKLFIIASTSVRLILDKFVSDPATQMQLLLHAFAHNHTPFKDLSHFYTVILRSAVPANCDDASLVERYQAVVGSIILVQIPLSIAALAHLIEVDVKQIRRVVRKLQSVILLGSDDVPRIYHQSFPDYITDLKRCQDINLFIDPRNNHTRITIRCFRIMKEHLKYNILGLGDPARFMSNEDGLAKDGITQKRLQEKILPQLQYACLYWANHFEVANLEDADLLQELEMFADTRILHWFEALSLIGKLDSAHRAIRVVLKILKPMSLNLRQLLSDGLRFISKFYEIIGQSALHTYYSALAFTPTNSALYQRYIDKVVLDTCHVIGGPEKWDPLITDLRHEDPIRSIQFSLDSTVFASRSTLLKVWDAATGTPISTIKGSGLRIANDFSTIASFKDNTITLHNVNGIERGATFTAQVGISAVAISSESSRIAAILSNRTVCLWDSGNGELLGSFGDYESNTYDRACLQFSAAGARLAYSSVDGAVKLRDGIDGKFIANLDCGSARVAFSPDGSRIASLQLKSGLKLWSYDDGKLVGIAENTGFHELAISTNGFLIATRGDKEVKLWSGNGGNPLPLIETLDLGLYLFSMAFSTNDFLAIATKSDIKIYNIKNHTIVSTLSYPLATVLTFSPDSSRLAAGNRDGKMYLWDVRDLGPSCSTSKQSSGRVTALALSPDCSRVACGFGDGAIELLETQRLAKRRVIGHRYHPAIVTTIGFSPEGRQVVSGSIDGTIMLWEGEDVALRGMLSYHTRHGDFYAVEISNNVLAAAGNAGIVLWDRQTLDCIHTFEGEFTTPLSFSANGALLAAAGNTTFCQIMMFNVTERTNMATFNIPNQYIRAMGFLPDNSHFIVQLYNGPDFYTFDLVNGEVIQGPRIDFLVQLCNFPLCHGVPVQVKTEGGQTCLRASFSQQDDDVPVLWVPRELAIWSMAHGRSIIALGCEDRRVVLVRLPSNCAV